MSDEREAFDFVVVGGGMVGAAFACACSGKGWRIAVIEARPAARTWPPGDIDRRVSAVSRASQRVLERLGAWGRIVDLGVSPYRAMRVWDAVGHGGIHFDSADLGEPDLGHIIENRVIQLALWERLEQADDIEFYCPADAADLRFDADAAHLELTDGRRLDAALVVGADGRDSWVRDWAGIATRGWAYDQQAIVAHVEVAHWHEETAWQRFLPSGPLAFLPLADGRCSIVWSVDDARAQELLALDDDAFREALGEAIEHRLGPIGAVTPRAAFSLRLQHAAEYVRPRLALIGDAAHAIHPLAGQGVNLGVMDAAELSATLDEARAHGRDIGGLWSLRRYERARRGDNLVMLAAMDGFNRVFSRRFAPIATARSVGLFVADRFAPLKRLFTRQAMGLGDDLPPLARALGPETDVA